MKKVKKSSKKMKMPKDKKYEQTRRKYFGLKQKKAMKEDMGKA